MKAPKYSCLQPSLCLFQVSGWLRRITTTVLVTSVLHHPMSAIAQVENSKPPTSFINEASYTYTDPGSNRIFQAISSQIQAIPSPLVDPLGRILGCGGNLIPDYTGFSIALYEPNPSDPTATELGQLLSLTRTELPDISNNNIPGGLKPNIENSNPYFLNNTEPRGAYNFLLDPSKGQLNPGKTYILVVNPPPNSIYKQRRIKIQILQSTGSQNNDVVRYVATSLDGQPIALTGQTTIESTVVLVPNAELQGLDLLAFEFTTNMCQPEQIRISKMGDRATAEPGDTVIYRLSLRNLADAGLGKIVITDKLPLGFNFLPQSVRGEIDNKPVTITAERNHSSVIFRTDAVIPSEKVLNIAYAAQLTADSIRGSGRNLANVTAQRVDNSFQIKDGPASHQLQIRPGIVNDCGTLIGRVFEDKNFDGEQQANEPGIPNAVIFFADGNRITTDINGLFSVANVLPGYHTGVLDLSSIPNYTFAPNIKFKERNSQSRLVRLEPGGMARMNFAVTPTSQEEVKK